MLAALSIFGDLERFIADDLYPYRYVITPLAVLAALAAAYVAYRLGVHRFVLSHRLPSAIVGVPLIVVSVIAGEYFLSPLWERSFLEEASPVAAAGIDVGPGPTSGGEAAPAAGARTTHRGTVKGTDDFHFGRGDALIISTGPSSNVLRLENFSVRNGPDLFVYLSKDESGRRVEEPLNLGRLKATDGAFNYEISSKIDISQIKSVVVWCRQFAVGFAVAVLSKT